MCKNYTRIEELPSGKRVFYVDIGKLPPAEADEYMKRIQQAFKGKDDEISYIIPIRSTQCTCRNTFDFEQWIIIIASIFCILPLLAVMF